MTREAPLRGDRQGDRDEEERQRDAGKHRGRSDLPNASTHSVRHAGVADTGGIAVMRGWKIGRRRARGPRGEGDWKKGARRAGAPEPKRV